MATGITLILFDIDGTLLNIYGAGRQAFSRALSKVFGWDDDIAYINFAGATDLLVLERIMTEQGHERSEGDEERFFRELPGELEKAIPGTEHVLHPGARELLDALDAASYVRLGLVTGNIKHCAYIKLRHFGLHDYFPFGGFGDEHADRVEIARLAVEKARDTVATGERIDRIFLIGDSPEDMRAARSIDACAVAVSTGSFEPETLHESGAHHVLEDLSDTEAVLELLGIRGQASASAP